MDPEYAEVIREQNQLLREMNTTLQRLLAEQNAHHRAAGKAVGRGVAEAASRASRHRGRVR